MESEILNNSRLIFGFGKYVYSVKIRAGCKQYLSNSVFVTHATLSEEHLEATDCIVSVAAYEMILDYSR
jgi:hypothetical protein